MTFVLLAASWAVYECVFFFFNPLADLADIHGGRSHGEQMSKHL